MSAGRCSGGRRENRNRGKLTFSARVKQEVKAVGTAVVNTTAAAAQRLAEQEAKAAQFINQFGGGKTKMPAAAGN